MRSSFQRGRQEACCLALLASLLAAAPAPGDDRPLTDADVARWLPRLRAEAAAFTKTVHEARASSEKMLTAMNAREALRADLISGRVDISEWLRTNVPETFIPQGAVYCAKCSQETTAEGGPLTAIFTFQKESQSRDLLRRAASGDEGARDELYARRGDEEQGKRSGKEKRASDFTAEIASQYRSRGYVACEGPPLSILTTCLRSPGKNVSVMISEVNYYCGLLPRPAAPSCVALPTGPMLQISFEGDLLHPSAPLDAGQGAATQASGEAAAEAKPDPEHERVRDALLLARTDAENPSAIEVEIPPDSPPEVKAELAKISALYAARRANVLVYKRHKSVLATLLEALTQLSNE